MVPRLLVLLVLASCACNSQPVQPADDILVRVGYVAIDPRAGSPIVVLEEESGDRTLPIWIGFAEARSIASEIEQRKAPRPNTHDLAKRVLDELHSRVERVVVTELRDGTYYAILEVRSNGHLHAVDARPSDAIALALRFEAPVFVRAALFREIETLPPSDEPERQARRGTGFRPAARAGSPSWKSIGNSAC